MDRATVTAPDAVNLHLRWKCPGCYRKQTLSMKRAETLAEMCIIPRCRTCGEQMRAIPDPVGERN